MKSVFTKCVRFLLPVTFCFFFSGIQRSTAQIAAWEFNLAAGNEATIAATTLNANLNSTSVSRGSGLLGSALANSYSSTDYTANGTLTDATNNNDYQQFTIQAQSGYKVSLSTLDANFRRSGTGPLAFQWRYSLDGFSTAGVDIGSAISYTNTATNGIAQTQINLSGITALQNVLSTTVITIRLYGYGATATGGTFALGRLAGNDLAIGGSVALNVSPTLTAGSLAGFGSVCVNATAGPNSFSITGNNLNGSPVTAGPLTGYTFSETANGTYTASVSPAYTAPNLSATIYVKFTPVLIQSYNGNIPVSGGGASAVQTAATGSGVDSPPTVTTGSATSILSNSATLNGTINSDGCSGITGYGVEYSVSNGFPNGTGTNVPSSNLSSGNFSSAISGLSPNTVYYFHAYAANSAGTAYGSQQSFTTAQLDAPLATAATSVGSNSFDANWNSVTDATGYRLDVATTSTFYAPSSSSVAAWNFPNNPDDNVADGGFGPNLTRQLNVTGATGPISYIPVALSATSVATGPGWDNGNGNDYWEINIVTAGYYNLTISSAQRSSATGPRDFKLQYKIGSGGTYTDVPGGTVTVANDWTTGVLNAIPLPAICENKISVFFRWIMTSNTAVNTSPVGSGGTSGIDNISITGYAGTFVPGYNNLSVAGLSQSVNTNINPNTTYYYRVRATGGVSTSANSNTISVTTTCTAVAASVDATGDASCFGSGDGQIDISVSNGTAPFTYAWTGPTFVVMAEPKNHSHPQYGTGSGNGYAINGVQGLEMTLIRGVTYTFDINSPGHPFFISTDATGGPASLPASEVTNGVTGSQTSFGTLTFTPNAGHPSLLYYQCTNHNNMGWRINIVDQLPDGDLGNSMAGNYSVTATDTYGCVSAAANTTVGEPSAVTYYYDNDGDTFGGTAESALGGCTPPSGFSENNDDCNDADNAIHPGVTDICNTIDDDCDGLFDEDGNLSSDAGDDQTICYTGTATMNGSFGGDATSASWSTGGDGSFDDINSMTAVYTPGPTDIVNGQVTLSLTTNDPPGGCLPGSENMLLTINTSVPGVPGAVTGAGTTACQGNTLPYSISPVATAISYTWTAIPINAATYATIQTGQGSTSVSIWFNGALPAGASYYPFQVTANNACGSGNPKTFSVRNKISQPNFTQGLPGLVCEQSNNVVFSITPVSGASTYSWSVSAGATINGPANGTSISVNFGTYSAVTISVTASNACMTTAARTMTVRSSPVQPGTITGNSTPCPGGTYVYSVAAVAGAASYSWTAPAGSVITPIGNGSSASIQFPSTISPSSVCVTANSSCPSSSPQRCKGIASGKPNTPGSITGDVYGTCGQTGVSYSVNQVLTATSYNWVAPSGATVSGPSNLSAVTIDFTNSFGSGQISVNAVNGCGAGGVRTLTVYGKPDRPGVITGNFNACANTIEQYTTGGSANATTYNWMIPAGASIVGPNNGTSIVVQLGSGGGTIAVTASNNCGTSGSRSAVVSVTGCRQQQILNGTENISVYPNPSSGYTRISFESASDESSMLRVHDLSGRIVLENPVQIKTGLNEVELNVTELAGGTYLMRIDSDAGFRPVLLEVSGR